MNYLGPATTKSVSLPEDLLKASEETAREQHQRWSEYVRQILIADQERRKRDKAAAQEKGVAA